MLLSTLVPGSFALSVWIHHERTYHLLDEMYEKMEAIQHSVKVTIIPLHALSSNL